MKYEISYNQTNYELLIEGDKVQLLQDDKVVSVAAMSDLHLANFKVEKNKNQHFIKLKSNHFSLGIKPYEEGRIEGDKQQISPQIESPMPGKILEICVEEGDEIKEGDLLATMEAMKMVYEISSPADARVEKINIQKGQMVALSEKMIELGFK